MTSSTLYSSLFTIRSANRTLPLVKTIMADLVHVSREVQQTRERLDQIDQMRFSQREEDEYGGEVASIEEHLKRRSDLIAEYLGELTALNLVPGKGTIECVDFPAIRNDDLVCLCWKLGETDVRHWHRFDEDCSHRLPVDLTLIRQSGDHAAV